MSVFLLFMGFSGLVISTGVISGGCSRGTLWK